MADRRDEDYDDDDAPRNRGRRDDDDRPRRRRQEEDDFDDDPRPKKKRLSRDKLRTIASRQKMLIYCILGYILCTIAVFFVPEDIKPFVGIPALVMTMAAAAFVFMLAMEIHGPGMGVLFGFLTLIPCMGLLILVILNQQAVAVLTRHGISVGFMGANTDDI